MEIGVIGGCGHIGLPLSLILAKKYKVTIIDPTNNKYLVKKKFHHSMMRELKNI